MYCVDRFSANAVSLLYIIQVIAQPHRHGNARFASLRGCRGRYEVNAVEKRGDFPTVFFECGKVEKRGDFPTLHGGKRGKTRRFFHLFTPHILRLPTITALRAYIFRVYF